MTRTEIIDEILRTAKSNRGKPLGAKRFEVETGIRRTTWGRFWARWGDAVQEAGLEPNKLTTAIETPILLRHYVLLARDLGHLPTPSEVKLRAYNDPDFPSLDSFRRLGTKDQLVRVVADFVRGENDFEDVLSYCEQYVPRTTKTPNDACKSPVMGFVYLMKSGKYCKIGRSNSVGRREYELGIQMPEPTKLIHTIETDDPVGIEAYWHNRFGAKRKNGEWFQLDAADVAAFKRRKFM